MDKLTKIVQQLPEDDFTRIRESLENSKADKFLRLFRHTRENNISNEEIQSELKVNSSAFYTLKSRLLDKVQEFLVDNMEGPKADLMQKVANIPVLLYQTPKATSLAILGRLEQDLQDFDMPHELTAVYSAFKKLHLHSPKQYEYAQLYNRHVAYTLSLDKAEDLLSDFTRQLSAYTLSKDPDLIEIMALQKKEMDNVCRLYDSHHLKVYQGILNASYALFLPDEQTTKDDDPVEDILSECEDIISNYPRDISYQYLSKTINFLFYEYYHSLKLYKKETEYFEALNEHLREFLFYNFCCFSSKFLISKIETNLHQDQKLALYKDSQELKENYEPDKEDVAGYVNYYIFLATSAFYAKEYNEAISLLNHLLNEISFKPYGHSEVEIKLLLALSYSMVNKYELAWGLIRSAARKTRELSKTAEYENVATFIKLLKAQMNAGQDSYQKLKRLRDKFLLLNRGEYKMLSFLSLDDAFLEILSRPVK